MKPSIFVLDVDGVMTTGHFLYSAEGKALKVFGAHDADGLKMLKGKIDIHFITADARGLPITRKRIVDDMGFSLEVVTESERFSYFRNLGFDKVIFMGDGYYDAKVMKHCAVSIAPANARTEARAVATYVTPSKSGEGAVLDAAIYILQLLERQEYKVCILAAGKGARMGAFTTRLNKALLPVHGKPAISHVIEKYPEEVEIVFAIGYLGEMLRLFVEAAYPKRKFTFVTVENFDGPGSGPGLSLLACKSHLQCPFILANVDALVTNAIPAPSHNWFGVAPVEDTSRFCSVADHNGLVVRIDDKKKTANRYAFTGIAGIHSYKEFWYALEHDATTISGERQVSNGFQELIKHRLHALVLDWYDTGTPETYAHAQRSYR